MLLEYKQKYMLDSFFILMPIVNMSYVIFFVQLFSQDRLVRVVEH